MKTIFTLIIITISFNLVLSQPFYDYHLILDSTAMNPTEIHPVDLTGDNLADVIATLPGTNQIAWFEHQFPGFSTPNILITGTPATSIHTADVDNDGDQDILATGITDLLLFKNQGNGNFALAQTIDNSLASPNAINSADFESDGDLDLLVSTTDQLVSYENQGNGTFTPSIINNTGAEYNTIGDFDGDGDPDILIQTNSELKWYENDGSGTLTLQPDVKSNSQQPYGVFAADLDGDGVEEAVYSADSQIGYYKYQAGSGLTLHTTIVNTNIYDQITLADADGDGDLDVAFSILSLGPTQTVYWVENTGNGTFNQTLNTLTTKPNIADLKSIDMENDSDIDFLSAGDGQILWYENIKPIDNDGDGYAAGADCNDQDATVYPGATEVCDGQDNDCNGIVDEAADLTIILTVLPGNVAGISPIGVAVEVTNIETYPTNGTPIRVNVPSDPRFTFIWDPTLTSVALVPINNSEWIYLGNNGIFHQFQYNNNIIPGNSKKAFGLQGVYDPQYTDGRTSLSSTIIPFGGGECNVTNNSDSERIIYFE